MYNINRIRSLLLFFHLLFMALSRHDISVLLWKLCYCDVTVSRHVWEWSGSVGRLIAKRDIPTYSTLINLNQIWHCSNDMNALCRIFWNYYSAPTFEILALENNSTFSFLKLNGITSYSVRWIMVTLLHWFSVYKCDHNH